MLPELLEVTKAELGTGHPGGTSAAGQFQTNNSHQTFAKIAELGFELFPHPAYSADLVILFLTV